MQTLLNLLPNITPEQHRELSTQLHVVEQVSLAQSAYPGAPMPHIDDQRRAKEVGKSDALLRMFFQQCVAAGIGNSVRSIIIEREIDGVIRKAVLTNN